MQKQTQDSQNWVKVFLPIWIGQAFSLLGSGLVQFALVWWLTQTTGSATVLALATLFALLPEVVVGPFIGALVDRWNRKAVMILADVSIAVATAILGILYWSGHVAVWHIYTLIFLRGVGGVFHWAAMQSSVSLMVPDQHLARVAGINQSLRGALNIAAPPLGALLMGFVPLYGILAIDVLTAIIAVSILAAIHIPQPKAAPAVNAASSQGVLADVRDGLRYVSAWPGMLALMIMAALLNFIAYPSFSLMPLLVTQHFEGSAWHLSAMESLWGLGIVLGGLLLGTWGGFRKKIYTALVGLIIQGFAFMLVAAAPRDGFYIALVGMSIAGIMNAMVNGPLFALVQAQVAPEMQGRVFTLIGSLAGAMSPLSMAIAGPTADWLGIGAWYWITAIGTTVMGAGSLLIPSIMHLEDEPAPDCGELLDKPCGDGRQGDVIGA